MSDSGTSHWTGRYHDGLTAAGQAVEVALAPDALAIRRPDGAPVAPWPYALLTAIEPVRAGQPAVLARGPEDDARLTLLQPCEFGALFDRAPQLAARPAAGLARGAVSSLLWLVVGGALLAALWFGWPKLADGLAALIPATVETRIGIEARSELIGKSRTCEAAPGQVVLDRLIARLTTAMHYDKPVAVTVVDLPIVNAFALPGGRILLFRGLLSEAQSPEEIAAVLAHELGHVAADHATRNLVRQFGLSLVIMGLSGNSNWDGIAQLLLASAYTRAFEAEADAHALATLEAASIGGQGWVDFFDRHAQRSGGWDRAIGYFSNHPPSAERRDQAGRLPATGTPVMSAGDWLVLQAICAR